MIASGVPPENRPWLAKLCDINLTAFESAYSRWSAIATAEHEWRQTLRSYTAPSWPSSVDIEAAAATLRKEGLSKVIAALRGENKSARELTLRLGLQANEAALLGDLNKLARHVHALAEFERDTRIAEIMGQFWKGISTPFDKIAGAIKLRTFIRGELSSFPSGDQVATHIVSLEPENFEKLGNFVALGRKFRVLAEPLKHWFEGRSIDTLIVALRAEIRGSQRLLDIDRDQALASIELPIREIAEIAVMLAQMRQLTKTLLRSPLAQIVAEFGHSIEQIEQIKREIDWIQSVGSVTAPSRLSQELRSSNAASARTLLRAAAAEGAPLLISFTDLLRRATQEFGVPHIQNLAAKALIEHLNSLLAHQAELPDFMAIREQRSELERLGLADILACGDRVTLSPDRIPNLFETWIAEARASRARRSAAALARQDGAMLEARRHAFAERDRIRILNDRAFVSTRLLESIPLPGNSSGPKKTWTEMALLKNEFPKQRRFTRVRELLSRASRSIQVLKPCFMMSPLSLAKFVRPNSLEFDLLLIDEASQMKPEDALGGMLRAKQIVVVGDSKQLPPTDFFTRSVETASLDDEFEDIDDESILESCQKTFRDVRRLKWHYRSRCESLIAFSNKEFYRDSPLITFPMARPGAFSIDLIRVDGHYQASRNVAEAVRVVEEAIEFMRHFSGMSEDTIPTLGIATVNIQQRDLIQEELYRLSVHDELIDQYRRKVEQKGEPVFVKNLENVQGDERDFIFVSLTYGREPGATAMKQRFGPINGKQGHRRLNVLFSRARIRIGLFTSFGSNDLRPSETSAEGVHVLKRYLEYVEQRGRAAVEEIGAEADSDFEIEVRTRLESRGYKVNCQVGVSGYKIDLGVRHPDHPETFLAGIECDGALYHSSKSARDRDRLREEVLRGLGWQIFRVWSTDWFDDPNLETDKLVKKLEQLRSRPLRTFNDYCIDGKRDELHEEAVSADGANVEVPASEDAPPPTTMVPEPNAVDVQTQISDEHQLTEADAVKVLEEFRDTVIKGEIANWEPHRSILREGMIETFIRQRVTDPEHWFQKVPQFQRSATNPVEKRLFLNRICEIIDRIGERHLQSGPDPNKPHMQTTPITQRISEQANIPFGDSRDHLRRPDDVSSATPQYVVADMSALDIAPRADRFYDSDYTVNIRKMTAHVIEVEGPIYDDLLVTRITRAHGFERAGSIIQKLVLSSVDRHFPRTREDGREVFWKKGSQTDVPIPYRHSSSEIRTHGDIPIAELASVAVPFVRLRMDDEQVLRKMSEFFQLERLREATRQRFQQAVFFAKSALRSRQ